MKNAIRLATLFAFAFSACRAQEKPKEGKDTASRDQIRAHFGHIAKLFAEGDFSAPMLIHAQNPPGVEAMKRLRNAIEYRLESTEKGARIRITRTSNWTTSCATTSNEKPTH